jgi:SAM-dependent methyltransferase
MKDGPPAQDHALETFSDEEAIRIEDSLWWVVGRMAIIARHIERAVELGPVSRIADIGCGSGGNLRLLAEYAPVIGVEPSEALARRARSRGVADAVFRESALELEECRNVDLFTMFDVLEHIDDDVGFLATLRERARPGHRLVASVPACPFLYGEHDRLLHHYRRYSARAFRAVLEGAGYRVASTDYFMFFLFPLAVASRLKDAAMSRIGRTRTTVEIGAAPWFLTPPLALSLRMEAFLSRHVRFPIGLWLFALAESPDV